MGKLYKAGFGEWNACVAGAKLEMTLEARLQRVLRVRVEILDPSVVDVKVLEVVSKEMA